MTEKDKKMEETIDTTKKKDKKNEKANGEKEEEKEIKPLDQEDIKLLMRYGRGPYFDKIKVAEGELKDYTDKIIKL